jgi:ABC-type sugar transport system substrate-binding protein
LLAQLAELQAKRKRATHAHGNLVLAHRWLGSFVVNAQAEQVVSHGSRRGCAECLDGAYRRSRCADASPCCTSPSTGWCSSVHIVFFPGGPAGGVFANNVYNGAKQAQADLGPRVDYVFSNWDPQTTIQQFNEAVASKPDGIAIMGHPGDEAFDSLIDSAESQAVIVTSRNTSLPIAKAKYGSNGFGYVGQDLYGSGMKLGTEAANRYGLKAGDRAMVWGLLSQPTRGLRTKGAIDALEQAGLTVD